MGVDIERTGESYENIDRFVPTIAATVNIAVLSAPERSMLSEVVKVAALQYTALEVLHEAVAHA